MKDNNLVFKVFDDYEGFEKLYEGASKNEVEMAFKKRLDDTDCECKLVIQLFDTNKENKLIKIKEFMFLEDFNKYVKNYLKDKGDGSMSKDLNKLDDNCFLTDDMVDFLEKQGFSVYQSKNGEWNEKRKEVCIEFGKGTPEGEDWVESVVFESNIDIFNNDKAFYKEISNRNYNFNIDSEVELWIDSRGKNGVPSSISDLLEDAKWKKKELDKLDKKLEKYISKREYKNDQKELKYLLKQKEGLETLSCKRELTDGENEEFMDVERGIAFYNEKIKDYENKNKKEDRRK